MPNGGSDCCGTCWFNSTNQGGIPNEPPKGSDPAVCTIRALQLERPFSTYCANHPHRRPDRDPVPIGPVFMLDSSGDRRLWQISPGTDEIRQHLLSLLGAMEEKPRTEYPIGLYADEVVVWQLGQWREERAVAGLRRIAAFNPAAAESGPLGRTREGLVSAARRALEQITGDSDRGPGDE